jgi:hypothetical protein
MARNASAPPGVWSDASGPPGRSDLHLDPAGRPADAERCRLCDTELEGLGFVFGAYLLCQWCLADFESGEPPRFAGHDDIEGVGC